MPQDTGLMPFNLPMFELSEDTTSQESIVSLEDSPARMSRLPGNALAYQKAHDLVFGSNLRELLANFDPQSSCWKTSQASLPGMEPSLLQTLPRWGMWDAGGLYRLLMQAHPIAVNDGSAWPTPRANERQQRNSQDKYVALSLAVKQLWPTPRAQEPGDTPEGYQKRVDEIGTHLAGGPGLATAVRMWSTPAAQDGKNGTLPPSQSERDTLPGDTLRNGETGSLNPAFVEMLMGYPPGYTDISSPPLPALPNIQQSRRALRHMLKTARKGSRP